jgi:hypothetical protein
MRFSERLVSLDKRPLLKRSERNLCYLEGLGTLGRVRETDQRG